MKLPVMLCAVVLAFAGSSFAQPVSDHASGVPAPPPPGPPAADYPPTGRELARLEAVRQARSEMLMACAADRQALCGSKTFAGRPEECLRYYRLKASPACRQGLDRVNVARRGS